MRKLDIALGLIEDPEAEQPVLITKKDDGTGFEVTPEGVSALDAFMAAHSAPASVDIDPDIDSETNSIEDMDEPTESA